VSVRNRGKKEANNNNNNNNNKKTQVQKEKKGHQPSKTKQNKLTTERWSLRHGRTSWAADSSG
jgi:hypothetical protein